MTINDEQELDEYSKKWNMKIWIKDKKGKKKTYIFEKTTFLNSFLKREVERLREVDGIAFQILGP